MIEYEDMQIGALVQFKDQPELFYCAEGWVGIIIDIECEQVDIHWSNDHMWTHDINDIVPITPA